MTATPAVLTANTPRRFYRGGRGILAFRGLDVPPGFDERRPEDWLGSTTRLFAEGGGGLTVLPDGATLADALAEDPVGWLGQDHLERLGPEPGVLVKLLDAAERLPVHTHPGRAFATRHLDCAHGKTEAWLVLDAAPGSRVWVGFRDDVSPAELAELVEAQDERLLAALNPIEVERGDAVHVPAGQPHAIGAGVMVVELQEPTDFSVMLEHARFGLDPAHAWLGLGTELALTSVTTSRLAPDALAALRGSWLLPEGVGSALPAAADEFFTAEVIAPGGDGRSVTATAGFSVLVVVGGSGVLTAGDARLPLRRGETLLVPHASGPLSVDGPVTVLRARPPHDSPGRPTPETPEPHHHPAGGTA